jgi:uncharacterized membrane protein YdjX (TVP38/TMEM64 family)
MIAKSEQLAILPVGLRRALRLALLLILTVSALIAWRWRAILDPTVVTAAITRHSAAPLWFLAAHLVASLLFVPRTLLAVVAGMLFGVAWGIIWAELGGVAGAAAGFLIARYINSSLIDLAQAARLRPVMLHIERSGWRGVALLRLVPIMPHSLANYGLALTGLGLGSFALGSLLGQLPITIAYVGLGAAGEQLLLGSTGLVKPTLIGLGALSLSLLIPVCSRWRPR